MKKNFSLFLLTLSLPLAFTGNVYGKINVERPVREIRSENKSSLFQSLQYLLDSKIVFKQKEKEEKKKSLAAAQNLSVEFPKQYEKAKADVKAEMQVEMPKQYEAAKADVKAHPVDMQIEIPKQNETEKAGLNVSVADIQAAMPEQYVRAAEEPRFSPMDMKVQMPEQYVKAGVSESKISPADLATPVRIQEEKLASSEDSKIMEVTPGDLKGIFNNSGYSILTQFQVDLVDDGSYQAGVDDLKLKLISYEGSVQQEVVLEYSCDGEYSDGVISCQTMHLSDIDESLTYRLSVAPQGNLAFRIDEYFISLIPADYLAALIFTEMPTGNQDDCFASSDLEYDSNTSECDRYYGAMVLPINE